MDDELFLFLDFDDTVSDAQRHNSQYVAELGYILSRDFDGEPEDWIPSISNELKRLMDLYTEVWSNNPVSGFGDWLKRERIVAANAVFDAMGKDFRGATSEPIGEYLVRAQFDGLTGTNAIFEGVYKTLQQLVDRGVQIHMASSQESEYLKASLIGAGINGFIETKFGPDLVDCPKEGIEYYNRLFENCNISPRQAIVIDDQPQCLEWAAEAGARVIQSKLIYTGKVPEFPVVLTHWNELPLLLNPYLR